MNLATLNAAVTIHTTDWARALALDVDRAAKSIHLSTLSMLRPSPRQRGPWPDLWTALLAAAQRQVEVNIYLAAPQPAHPATAQNRHTAIVAHNAKLRCNLIPGPSLLHAKCCVIDCRLVWTGSGNFTAAACGHNKEIYARIESAPVALQTLESLFYLLPIPD